MPQPFRGASLLALLGDLLTTSSPLGAATPHAHSSLVTLSSSALRRELVGFAASGEMILLESPGTEGPRILALVLPSGPLVPLMVLASRKGDRTLDALRSDRGWQKPTNIPLVTPHPVERGVIAKWNIGSGIAISVVLEAALGDRREARILARRGFDEIVLERMPILGTLTAGPLGRAPDERHLVLITDHDGQKGIVVLDAHAVDASLLNLTALRAFFSRDYFRAVALFEEAIARDPRRGDAIYNLACVHSVLGNRGQAVFELSIALALEPTRYVRLARVDPDLEPIRDHPEICATLRACPP